MKKKLVLNRWIINHKVIAIAIFNWHNNILSRIIYKKKTIIKSETDCDYVIDVKENPLVAEILRSLLGSNWIFMLPITLFYFIIKMPNLKVGLPVTCV